MGGSTQQAWADVQQAGERLKNRSIAEFFAEQPTRCADFSRQLDDLLVDFSKERLDSPALQSLLALAKAAQVEQQRDAMFAGTKINNTEDRAVLHMALRDGLADPVIVDGQDVQADRLQEQQKFLAFAEAIRTGTITAADGQPFRHVINIGIGGSDLGPVMAVRALSPDADGLTIHFVSNVDGAHLGDQLKSLQPERTLVIVASKTFTTSETMQNARSAKAWLEAALGAAYGQHLCAVSTNLTATAALGIETARVFAFWDWVGGRYSLWSAIGLPLAIAIGAQKFQDFLAGAASMDTHFRDAPLANNLPVLLGLIGIWRRNVLGYSSLAVIPFDQRLERFPAYLQQMDMESNGKSITKGGTPIDQQTSPVIWGEPGTNAQHSFFQLLHQGADIIPVDFLVAAQARDGLADHHQLLLSNCLAQSQALAFGKSADQVRAEISAKGNLSAQAEALVAHRTFHGNRPSTTILYRTLDAFSLGRLIALYEHKVFVQGVIWDVNSFDQWGVELGKQLAPPLAEALQDPKKTPAHTDPSTLHLLQAIRTLQSTKK